MKQGSIRHYRQVGETKTPASLPYGELAVAKDGTLYAGNESDKPVAQLTNLDLPVEYSKSGIEMDPNFTLNSGGYFQFGKITVVNMRVTNKNAVVSNGPVCSGLPKPLREADGKNVVVVVSSYDRVQGVLYQSGESLAGVLNLYYMYTETGNLPAGTTQRLLAVYLAE